MTIEPYYRPGESEGRPPQSPTQFDPAKPAGPDPVSPAPLGEGTEFVKHAQLYAYDPTRGKFYPVEWTAGKLKVDAILSSPPGGMNVNVDWIDQYFTVIDTHVTRDPATGLVMAVAETDGVRTRNSIITRDANFQVTRVQEVLV